MDNEYIEVFDWKQTLLFNLLWILSVCLVSYVTIKYMNIVKTFNTPEMVLMGILAVPFMIIKLYFWVGGPVIKTKHIAKQI